MPHFCSRLVLFTVVSVSFFAGFTAPVAAQEATPAGANEIVILASDESYVGVTRGEWDARWWQWTVSMPQDINPNFDLTGERCGYGQSGPVFFLPADFTGEPATVTCIVPAGTAILVGVAGSECSSVEPLPYFGRNEEELRACAAANTDAITDLQASLNGREVPNLETYRTSSPLFTLTFGEDNLIGVPAGVAWSVSESYSFIIPPLPPGEYGITLSALYGGELALGRSYRVIVRAPLVIEPAATPETGTPVP